MPWQGGWPKGWGLGDGLACPSPESVWLFLKIVFYVFTNTPPLPTPKMSIHALFWGLGHPLLATITILQPPRMNTSTRSRASDLSLATTQPFSDHPQTLIGPLSSSPNSKNKEWRLVFRVPTFLWPHPHPPSPRTSTSTHSWVLTSHWSHQATTLPLPSQPFWNEHECSFWGFWLPPYLPTPKSSMSCSISGFAVDGVPNPRGTASGIHGLLVPLPRAWPCPFSHRCVSLLFLTFILAHTYMC